MTMTTSDRDLLITINANVAGMERRLQSLEADVRALREQTNKWRGGLWALSAISASLGAAAGWFGGKWN